MADDATIERAAKALYEWRREWIVRAARVAYEANKPVNEPDWEGLPPEGREHWLTIMAAVHDEVM
jgi:hypothetical protein